MAEQHRPSAEGVARRRKNDPAAMRARILDAAFGLFQARGYNATSVLEIAAGARVTSGALHHHFPTKKALGHAVIEERVASAVEETWFAPVRSASSARTGIGGIFKALARELDAQGSVRGCPVNNLTLELAFADADFRVQLRGLFERWSATIADRLAGEGKADPSALATTVIATYSGAMAIAKAEQRGEPLRLCWRQLSKLL